MTSVAKAALPSTVITVARTVLVAIPFAAEDTHVTTLAHNHGKLIWI